MVRSIHQQWLKFAGVTVDPRASKVQLEDTETAFKAGAISVLLEQLNVVSNLPDEQALAVLVAWKREVSEYFRKLEGARSWGPVN